MHSFQKGHAVSGNLLLHDSGAMYNIEDVHDEAVVASRTFIIPPDLLRYWYKRGPNGTRHSLEVDDLVLGTIVMRGNEDRTCYELSGEFVVTAVRALHNMVVVTQTLILDDSRFWSVIIRK